MKHIFFLALHITAVSIPHVAIITFFSDTFIHYAVATKTFLW